jgi:hypothetical protein
MNVEAEGGNDTGEGVAIQLRRGAEKGRVLGWDGAFLEVELPLPFAPGAPVSLMVELEHPLPFEGKSLGSKRNEAGLFVLKVRPVMLSKHARLALDALKEG